ncbi:MAG: methylated-DNA--[protein]-cysteine S-methyltransferase [Actinomycetota bacterium]|nr:methylated-DNA--[protein]-cysteine S-methyltransferase [Actinomycetota bacterium]
MSTPTTWSELESPVGPLRIFSDGQAVTALGFAPFRSPLAGAREGDDAVLVRARIQLQEYFAGERRDFDLALAPAGTAFRRRVWAALRGIPYGQTASYGQIAARLGMASGASRAVGGANGANPIAIVVPCHRVIGADGTLTGFAGGLERKRALLDLEGVATAPALF